jgi:anaerobic selenocysteine-containing dehydrogenase
MPYPMSDSTRRGFLKIAGAGAAVGAAAVATTAAVKGSSDKTPATAAAVPAGATGALVAYVKDVRGAEVSVMVGQTEVVVHDRELVARLATARSRATA